MNIKRTNVLWFGSDPNKSVTKSLSDFDFTIVTHGFSRGLTDSEFSNACALVVSIPEEKAGLFFGRLDSLIIPALNHGLLIIVECPLSVVQGISEKILSSKLNQKLIKVIVNNEDNAKLITKFICIHVNEAGPPYRESCSILTKEINSKVVNLTEEEQVFLKRAFFDCDEITLKSLKSGFSATGVYSIHATKGDSRPMPFFAKFNTHTKVESECENYREHVLPFIPFNLRPNIDSKRCIQGAKNGLIVGNFVENSDSLWNYIRSGNSKSAIYSAFDTALHAWRHPLKLTPSKDRLFEEIEESDPEKLNFLSQRFIFAKTYENDVSPPIELIKKLNSLPLVKYIKTRVHGDLHTENIRVRNGEAILIDFEKVGWGPSSMDSAMLEIWIAFNDWPQFISFHKWKECADKLYDISKLHIELPHVMHEPEEGVAIWNAIRQIRLLAFPLQLESQYSEYQGCLAYWMYRMATYPINNSNKNIAEIEEKCRGYAYYLSNQLANNMLNRGSKTL